VVDTKREYRFLPIDGKRLKVFSIAGEPRLLFNPLAPPKGVDSEHWDRAFADVFTRTYGLSEPSRRILLDSLFELRHESKDEPTLRELEKRVSRFRAGSPKEQGSQRSLESRLHIINTGPVGESLNTEGVLDAGAFAGTVAVFEIGEVDSLKDQRFLAELIMLYLWQHDRAEAGEDRGELRRLIVIEEAHRYLSEERPPEQRGERTLLELAIAEARRYGWGFVIVDQMPVLLSRYVWDNVGTVFFHRLANRDSLEKAWKVLVEDPLARNSTMNPEVLSALLLSLPEDLTIYRRYGAQGAGELSVGVALVPRVKKDSS
jgi:DNA helicase HerA-like ATPase